LICFVYPSPINEPEYGLLDKVNWVRGLITVHTTAE
jgi:hypothetical protein